MEGGIKKDAGKPQHDLIPFEALDEIAKVFTFGCIKYSRSDWAKGIKISRLLSAAYRHMGKFNAGEEMDPESNLPHIAHAATNLIMLIYLMQNKPELDDRWSKENKKCSDQKE
jgi:hypothetical protein